MESLSRSDIFEHSNNGKDVKCKVCNCWLHCFSEKIVQDHVNGKKHNLHVERLAEKEYKLKHGIYVKGFDPLLDDLEEKLRQFFQTIGGPIKDIYVDKNAGNYCIVEFVDLESVERSVSSEQKTFHGKKLVVRHRDCSKSLWSSSTSQANAKSMVTESKATSLTKELEDLLNKQPEVDAQMKALYDHLHLTAEEMEMRTLVCELLQSVLEEAYPGCVVRMFGSSVNGLGARKCDLDVTVLVDESAEERASNDVMKEVREIIERYAPGFKNVLLVHSAKNCSIVKMCHTQSQLNVDLSLNNRLAIENTSLLQQYVNGDERLVPLFLTIRYWARMNSLTGRSGMQISNYALTLMIIHYLQQLDLPYLKCLQTCHQLPRVDIDQWNCAFCKDHSPSNQDTAQTTGQLLSAFFQFYRNYPFRENVVAIHTEDQLKRSDHCIAQLNSSTALVVQDPFKLSHNVAQNMTENGLTAFQSICKETYNTLSLSSGSNLVSLFTQPATPRSKPPKRKRANRSNEYLISLPNCSHQRMGDKGQTSSTHCCYYFTRDMLLTNLKMQIHTEPCDLTDLLKEKETSLHTQERVKTATITENRGADAGVFMNKNDSIQDCSEETSNVSADDEMKERRKRRLEDSTIDCVDVKKQKLAELENVQYYAYAFFQTWVNRRKERRRLKHCTETATESNDTNADKVLTLDSEQIKGDVKTEEVQPKTPRLCVKVSLSKATCAEDVCKMKLEPVSDETVQTTLADFQIFYAYLKKELVTVFK